MVEKWEDYILPNHLPFSRIEEEFLAGTRVMLALEEISSHYLKKGFQKVSRKFLEELTSTVLSTVAAR